MLSFFPKGTAAGPSVMYPEHLSNVIRCNNPVATTLQKLTSLINFCSASGFPIEVGPTFCSASLTALKKKTVVRPIAVRELFHRLVAKCPVSFAKEEAVEIFCPNQLGVAIRGGVESFIHATKLIYEEFGKREGLGVLQIYFENAFKQQGVLSECQKQIPGIYRFVSSCHAKHSSLFYNRQAIKIERGVQRGDLLGPLLFSLALMPLINKIKQEVPMLLQNS